MSRAPSAHRSRPIARRARALILLLLALSLTSASCGSSEPQTKVLGEVESQTEAASDVQLIDAVCITNTPTRALC